MTSDNFIGLPIFHGAYLDPINTTNLKVFEFKKTARPSRNNHLLNSGANFLERASLRHVFPL